MTMTLDQLEAEVMKLPAHLRARLAELLISSLDEEAEIEQAQADEAARRWEEVRTGAVTARPASQVFANVRVRLNE